MIKASKINTDSTRFNQLRGSGLYYRDNMCNLDQCIPRSNITPKTPVPTTLNKVLNQSICGTKISNNSNMWELNGVVYKTFNSFWVNIPKQFVRLKINGRGC